MLPTRNDQPNQVARPRISAGVVGQHARLSIGVSGLVGGALLLAANTTSVLLGGTFALIPFVANAALVFGGVMFLRERSKAARR